MLNASALPTWLDVAAMALNGMFGAAIARSRSFPVFGTLLSALLIGLGGGMARDVLLGHEPAAIQHWFYIAATLPMAVVGALFYRPLISTRLRVQLLHVVVLALLVTIGGQVALRDGAPLIPAMLLALITVTAGGIVVDGMSNERSSLARADMHWLAAALGAGAIVFVLVSAFVNFWLAIGCTIVVIAVLNVVSIRANWPSPIWPGESAAPKESE